MDVDAILALDDEVLLRQCTVEFYKSGGPGGQKRNKTSSAARVTHRGSGVEGHSADFRSQAQNRLRALHRLRFHLAAQLRTTVEWRGYSPPAWVQAYQQSGRLSINVKNPAFARVAAHALDLLTGTDGNVGKVAALLGVTTSSLVKCLKQEHGIWDAACRIRRTSGLPSDPFGR